MKSSIMTFWIINHYAIPENSSGGTRHAIIAKYLVEFGHKVVVLAASDNLDLFHNKHFYDKQINNNLSFRFIKVFKQKSIYSRFFQMIFFKINLLNSTADLPKPDIIIGSSVHLHAALGAKILAYKFSVPFIFEIRDLWPQTLIDLKAISIYNPIYWYLKYIELSLIKSASFIITLLPGIFPYLNKYNYPKDKIFYLPNGVDSTIVNFPEIIKSKDNYFKVYYFGSHGIANGLDTLIDAAKLIQDNNNTKIQFILIGDGNIKEDLIQKANDLNLINLIFKPSLLKNDLYKEIVNADCFVFTLLDFESIKLYGISSNKLFDYMLFSKPIIFSCNSFNNPVKESNCGISIKPQNSIELSKAILSLYNKDKAELDIMGYNGRKWVLDNHDFKLNVKNFLNFINNTQIK